MRLLRRYLRLFFKATPPTFVYKVTLLEARRVDSNWKYHSLSELVRTVTTATENLIAVGNDIANENDGFKVRFAYKAK